LDKKPDRSTTSPADSGRTLRLWLGDSGKDDFQTVASALSHGLRMKILRLLGSGAFSVARIARELDVPVTTVHFNVNVLEEAGLVSVIENAAARGKEHVVSRKADSVVFDLMMHRRPVLNKHVFRLPIGSYFDAKILAPCGMASERGVIGEFDSPDVFLSGARMGAQILWISGGMLEYRVPNSCLKLGKPLQSLSISCELCSEMPNYNNDWRSDITFWLNGEELCTYTSPGDFGGRRGIHNPDWWSNVNTQYGLLVNITAKENAVYLNGVGVAGFNPKKLNLAEGEYFTLRIGIKPNAKNYGGLNLFGSKFGDYAQDIVVTIDL